MKKYFINDNGTQKGPFTLDELKSLNLKNDTHVWYDGMEDWVNAGDVNDLKEYIVKMPPPIGTKSNNIKSQTENVSVNRNKSSKLKYVIWLLFVVLILFIGYNEIEKHRIEERLRQQEFYENQRRMEEAEAKRQHKLIELRNQFENTLTKIRLEEENLNEIKKFKFLRTSIEKEQEIESQIKVIRKLELKLNQIQNEIDNLK